MAHELQLPEGATAPRSARRWLRPHLVGLADGVSDDLELLLTEVVTNAVVHARTASTVRIARADDLLCVEVEDGSPYPPRRRRTRTADDEHGRGVELLDSLATRWGVRRVQHGKVVWFCVGRA